MLAGALARSCSVLGGDRLGLARAERVRGLVVDGFGVEVVVGDLTVDTAGQTASRGGRLLPLTTKEYALLEYLARNAGRVVSRADICAHVWDDNHDPYSNAIEVYIHRLRKKIEKDSDDPQLIKSVRGAGYILVAPVSGAPS